MSNFELTTLKEYFRNIIMACDNENHDERKYIKGIAKCGLDMLEKIK